MARLGIYLSNELAKQLRDYCQREWGNHYSLSAIIQKAVKEFLEKENGKKSIEELYHKQLGKILQPDVE